MGGGRKRRAARDRKYSVGVDLSASYDVSVIGHWESGVFVVDRVLKAEPFDPSVIDGQAVKVESRPDLLDAGGSEP